MNENWILLNTYVNRDLAAISQGYLEEQGILTVIINKQDSMYQSFGQFELYCHLNQAHDALNLLENLNNE
ncbi:MAG: hypothetical protein EP332_12375 [Bacteroidetes bacterium]|nr:MAG: hypothetical protein EP332_12375 [Bacteroidota bacterium]